MRRPRSKLSSQDTRRAGRTGTETRHPSTTTRPRRSETAPAPQAEVAPAPQDDRAARAVRRLEDGDYVLIQDKMDKDDNYSKVSGELKPAPALGASRRIFLSKRLSYVRQPDRTGPLPLAGQVGQSLESCAWPRAGRALLGVR